LYSINSRFLQIPASERNEKFDKHRFLVQSKVIDDAVYEKLQSLQGNDKSEEVSYTSSFYTIKLKYSDVIIFPFVNLVCKAMDSKCQG